MSTFNFPAADFTPQLAGYTGQGAFRFWCQKVLPIVYDDSLSYYELLGKVVHYLNNVIKDMATAGENIDSLLEAFNELQDYVNQYLDLEKAVSDKLDQMADDGTLSKIFSPVIEGYFPEWLENHPEAYTTVDYSITQKVYNTVMDMAMDARLEAGDKVCTCGYYAPYDGGGAIYNIREIEETDVLSDGIDGSTSKTATVKLVAEGLCAEYSYASVVNVLCVGVKRNTEEDQFINLFKAVQLPNLSSLYLPTGRYVISNTINIPEGCTVFGDGDSSELYFNGQHTDLGGAIMNGGSNVTFRDFRIEHLAHNNPTYYDVESGTEKPYFVYPNSIFMYTDTSHTLSSFINGIGFANLEFNSWVSYVEKWLNGDDPSASEIDTIDVENLKAINIYSNSCYPLQTESTPSRFAGDIPKTIKHVIYDNIMCPRGMVSIYPQTDNAYIEDIEVNNIDCLYFRVGIGHQTGKNFTINNVNCKVANFLAGGCVVNNLVCDGRKTPDFNWYTRACGIYGDIAMNNVKMIRGSTNQNTAFSCFGAFVWSMSNCLLAPDDQGNEFSWGITGGSPATTIKFSNCTFVGNITSGIIGEAVNCVGNFPVQINKHKTFSNYLEIPPSPDIENLVYRTSFFNTIGLVVGRLNSGDSGESCCYIVTKTADSGYAIPIHETENCKLVFDFVWDADPNNRRLQVAHTCANYVLVSVFCVR